jgi:hypothetical protein
VALPPGCPGRWTGGVFTADEVTLQTGFTAACTALARLATSGLVMLLAQDAYRQGGVPLLGAGRVRALPGTLRLAGVRLGELAVKEGWARLPLRWEATGPGGPFPVLDADITLVAAGKYATVVGLAGAYRLPPSLAAAGLDQEIIGRCAGHTTGDFLGRLAGALAHPAGQPQSAARPASSAPPA